MTAALPLVLLGAPVGGALWIVLARRRTNLREAGSLVAAIAMAAAGALLAARAAEGDIAELILFPIVPGAPLHLRADAMGAFFAAMASGLWVLTTLYSIGYTRGLSEPSQTRYYFWFAVCLFASGGLALAANLPTFFLFYELLTVATYPLVVHKGTPEAIRSGRKYLVYTLSAGLCLLVAILWSRALSGTVELRAGGTLPAGLPADMGAPLLLLFVVGVGVKAGVMPLHSWLPSAMVAPTPVSALLHAVAVVKAGVFGVARVVGWIFGSDLLTRMGGDTILAWAAAVTIVASSLIALTQDNLKRRLAFSTIGQLSYCVLGIALATPAALAGGVLHMAGHGVMKITLFFCAGAIYVASGKERVSQLDGIGRRMPVTMGAFAVASVGLSGFPPLPGFPTKWLLLEGSLTAGHLAFAVALIASGVLNMAYLFPIVIRAFSRTPDGPPHGEAPRTMVIPLAITAALCFVLGLSFDAPLPFLSLVHHVVAEVFP